MRYGGNLAVRSVSLEVLAGTITAVVGVNGAGKTSLLAGLMGLERRSGMILFEGRDISRDPPERNARRGMILVPERRELFGTMSVLDNLILGGVVSRGAGGASRESALIPYSRNIRASRNGAIRWPEPCRVVSGRCQRLAAR